MEFASYLNVVPMNCSFFYYVVLFSVYAAIIGLKVVMLSLAWKLKAEQMGFFTLSEWVRGMTELQYETSDFYV